VELRPATKDDLPAALALLDAAGLPVADVSEHFGQFVVAVDDGVVGLGGLEVYGDAGLLRSVCVDEGHRGSGLGGRLCEMVESRARALGVRELYLLTTTAGTFFEARGYVRVDRNRAPASVQQTTEFQSLCPSTAACLVKKLDAVA